MKRKHLKRIAKYIARRIERDCEWQMNLTLTKRVDDPSYAGEWTSDDDGGKIGIESVEVTPRNQMDCAPATDELNTQLVGTPRIFGIDHLNWFRNGVFNKHTQAISVRAEFKDGYRTRVTISQRSSTGEYIPLKAYDYNKAQVGGVTSAPLDCQFNGTAKIKVVANFVAEDDSHEGPDTVVYFKTGYYEA